MRILFAGAENEKHLKEIIQPAGWRNILMSYYYLKWQRDKNWLHSFLQDAYDNSDYMFLDSWAHTFLTMSGERKWWTGWRKKKKEVLDPYKYMEEYFIWLEEFGKYFHAVAELDIAWVFWVTYWDIQNWRKEFQKRGLHNKVVVVSHPGAFKKLFWSWEGEWENMCKEFPLLAIGDNPPESVLDKHFGIWQKVGNMNRIHWFGETKPSKIIRYPYFSVDSTSWNIWSRYWLMLAYDRKRIKMQTLGKLDRTNIKTIEESKEIFAKSVLPYLNPESKKISIDDYFDWKGWVYRDQQNVRAFMDFQNDATKSWLVRWINLEGIKPKV